MNKAVIRSNPRHEERMLNKWNRTVVIMLEIVNRPKKLLAIVMEKAMNYALHAKDTRGAIPDDEYITIAALKKEPNLLTKNWKCLQSLERIPTCYEVFRRTERHLLYEQ